MKRILLVLFLFLLSTHQSKSQTGFSWDRVVFGGNFGAGFGTNQSLIAVSPSVGYRVTERLTLGTGVIYQYYRYKFANLDFKFNNYGARFFGTYQLNDFLVLHAEQESLNLEYLKFNALGNPDGSVRRKIGSTFVGAGYRQYISSNSMVDLLVLFNLTETTYTPYSNPIIRVNFGFGL